MVPAPASPLSLWHDGTVPVTPRPGLQPVDLGTEWDVVIAGAGFTGLWTALGILTNQPDAKVLVLEKHVVGYGASGRNGGWVSALFPTETPALIRRHGHAAAQALRTQMAQTVDDVGRVASELGIECDFVKGGTTVLARTPVQLERARHHLAVTEELAMDRLEWREPSKTLQATHVLGATWTPDCARFNPWKLVRGLADAVEKRGGVIREMTAARGLHPGRVQTEHGDLRTTTVIDALEAYRASLPRRRRMTLPLYSLMIATEPLPDAVFDEIGLAHGETFADYRRLIIYGQRTADNRIAFGGRGAPYHFGSRIRPSFDRVPRVFDALQATLVEMFPVLATATITHRWGGPLGIPRDWHARVVFDQEQRIGVAGGYVGDGVGLSHLAGSTLADLVTGVDSPRTKLPLVDTQWPLWEPEPLRYAGSMAGIIGTSLTDRIEDTTGRESLLGRLLAPLTGG